MSRFPTQGVAEAATSLEAFEAGASEQGTPTGRRREGRGFERLTTDLWDAIAEYLVTTGCQRCSVVNGDGRCYTRLTSGGRELYLPCQVSSAAVPHGLPAAWFQLAFPIDGLIEQFPGEAAAIERYAPETGPYAGSNYPRMYARRRTTFDGTVVLSDAGVLKQKILLEYKTAKSSKHGSIDGNAHERLTFQIMQYLEVATRYTSCTLTVLANGSFARYRNKYHPAFHVQADRLTNFAWFHMDHLCTANEYIRFARELSAFLAPSPVSTP